MPTLSELRTFVYRDLAQPSSNNDRLSTTTIDAALNEGYRQFCLDVWARNLAEGRPGVLFAREVSMSPGNNTRTYARSVDSVGILHLAFAGVRLLQTSLKALDYEDRTWRTTSASTPTHWYMDDDRYFGLYPIPTWSGASPTLKVWAACLPHTIGGGIASAARVSNNITFTFTGAHELTANDTITTQGTTPAGATTFNAALTVGAVPTALTCVCANTAADDTATGGMAYFTDGVSILYNTTDIPKLRPEFHMALVHWAVYQLAGRHFSSAETAEAVAGDAKAGFDALVEAQRRVL